MSKKIFNLATDFGFQILSFVNSKQNQNSLEANEDSLDSDVANERNRVVQVKNVP